MNYMKYKVGDKVKVKSFDWYEANKDTNDEVHLSDENFVSEMSNYCGKILTIEKISEPFYYLKEDSDKYSWTDEMFEDSQEMSLSLPGDLFKESKLIITAYETKIYFDKFITQNKIELCLGNDFELKTEGDKLFVVRKEE